jgi:hypothetical protein
MARPRSRADRGSYPLDTAQSTPEARTRVKLPPDPYRDDDDYRPRRGRRPLIIVGTLAALFLIVALVNRSTHHSSSPQTAGQTSSGTGSNANGGSGNTAGPTGPVTAPAQGGLPTNSADKVPVGYQHNSAGAESAAANYVVAYTSSSMVRSSARHALIDAIADPDVADGLQQQLDTSYQQANSTYGLSADGTPPSGQTFVQRTAPMGVTLVSDSGNEATVSVWEVTLAGLAGQGSTHPVTEAWSTVKVSLHWTRGDWKWVSFTATDGPVPTSGQQLTSSGEVLQNAVDQFGGLRYAR